MRNLTALLFLMSLCSLHLVFSAPLPTEKTRCCTKTSKVKIPIKNIEAYRWTSNDCMIKAIVFKTKAQREICVDPEAPWVRNHMKVVEQELSESGY